MKFLNRKLTMTDATEEPASIRPALRESAGAIKIHPAFLPGAIQNQSASVSIEDIARAIYAEDDDAMRHREFTTHGRAEGP